MGYLSLLIILVGCLIKTTSCGYCTYATSCSKYSHRSCGTWGWSRCGYTKYYKCYKQRCCDGWGGSYCNSPICSNPCRNGGTCVSPYTCKCSIYYTGSSCQTKKSCTGKQMELFFLLDSSGSIGQANFGTVKEFVRNVSQELDIGQSTTRVGLMTFSRYPFIRFNIVDTVNKSEVLDDVDSVPYISGMTETHTALRLLQQEGYFGSRSNVPHVAILITEGKSLHSNETKAAASSLHSNGIQMFVIGIGPAISSTELHNIATDPDSKHLITVKRYEYLPSILEKLTTLTCDVSAHTYTPLTTPKPVLIKYARREPIHECLGKAADIVFVLDSTKTIGQAHFKSVKHFALDIVNDLDIADNATRVGVVTFSTYPLLRLELGRMNEKLHLLNFINNLLYYTGTRETDRALELLRIEGFLNRRPDTPNVAVLITDGPASNSFLTNRAADELKQSDVEVFVVGVGENIDIKELGYISTNHKDNVFAASNFEELGLSSFEGVVARAICKDIPILTTQSTTPTTSTTSKPTSTSQYSSSRSPWVLHGNDTSDCVPEVKDIMFLLDSSSRVGEQNFLKMKMFVKHTVDTFNISPNLTRVGLILYNTNATIVFPLDKYNASQDIQNAVDNIVYKPADKTNTGDALEFVRKQGFIYDRREVPNIAFLISDGYSSDKNSTRVQARLAKQNNTIQIFATAVGQSLDFDELVDIASSNPYTNQSLIYHVDDFDDLHVMSLENVFTSVICGFELSTLPPKVSMSAVSASVTPPCYNVIKNCDEYRLDMCTSYRPWAMGHCKQYCGFCQGTTAAAKQCVDQIGNCNEYGTDMCTSTAFRKWTKDHCQHFCGLCGADTTTSSTTTTTTTSAPAKPSASTTNKGMLAMSTPISSSNLCTNKISSCEEFGSDICTDYQSWAKEHCQQHCGFCQAPSTTPNPCADTIDNCNEYGSDICISVSFSKWTKDHCAKFCNLCDTAKDATTLAVSSTIP